MNKTLLAIFCLLLPFALSAQSHEFNYHKNKNLVYLTSDEHTYEYKILQSTATRLQTTLVESPDGSYKLLTKNGKYGALKTVLNSRDSLLATVFLTGEKKNGLLLPDGRMLQYKKINNLKWAYLYNGKEVVTYSSTQKGGRKRVIIEYHDASFNLDAIQLLCLDHGRTKLTGNPTLALIAISAVTTVVFTLASRENDKTTLP